MFSIKSITTSVFCCLFFLQSVLQKRNIHVNQWVPLSLYKPEADPREPEGVVNGEGEGEKPVQLPCIPSAVPSPLDAWWMGILKCILEQKDLSKGSSKWSCFSQPCPISRTAVVLQLVPCFKSMSYWRQRRLPQGKGTWANGFKSHCCMARALALGHVTQLSQAPETERSKRKTSFSASFLSQDRYSTLY